MNDIIETFIHDHLFLHLVLIAVSMTAIIIAMGIDFISGIQKAKQRGELRTSKKYKMTATKAKKYFNRHSISSIRYVMGGLLRFL